MHATQGALNIPMVLFDTMKFVRHLVKVGMPTLQAEALAKEHSRLIQHQLEQVATKADIHLLRNEVQGQMHCLKAELETKLMQLQFRIAIIIGGSITTATGILLTAMKLLMH